MGGGAARYGTEVAFDPDGPSPFRDYMTLGTDLLEFRR
jgi:hypothetical protein